MVEELQRLFEEVARQPEEVQLRLAEILRMELEEDDEIEVSPELSARLDASREEIARGDYVSLEELDRHRPNQGRCHTRFDPLAGV